MNAYESNANACSLLEAFYKTTVAVNFAIRRKTEEGAVGCVVTSRDQSERFVGRRIGRIPKWGTSKQYLRVGIVFWHAIELALDATVDQSPVLIFTCWSDCEVDKARGAYFEVKTRIQGKMGTSRVEFKYKKNDSRFDLANRVAKKCLDSEPIWTPEHSTEVLGQAVERKTKASPLEGRLLQALLSFFPEPYVFAEAGQRYAAQRAVNGGVLVPQFPVTAGCRRDPEWGFTVENRYFLDFAIISGQQRLCVEVDGAEYHTKAEDKAKDAERERNLRSVGWQVVRFKGTEVFQDVEACARKIMEKIR